MRDHNYYPGNNKYILEEKIFDLNEARAHDADTNKSSLLQRVSFESESLSVHFDFLENRLIEKILKADLIVGCVAWLTSFPILDALAQKESSLIVQKEDFLRPDLGSVKNTWKYLLRKKYEALKSVGRYFLPGWAGALSYCSDPHVGSIRCCGNRNSDKNPASPRMHHKFAVFCKASFAGSLLAEGDAIYDPHSKNLLGYETTVIEDDNPTEYTPYEVWTGSFNFTKNAGQSLENAICLRDPSVVNAYVNEYCHILSLSEPLDWEYDWLAPEWRLGS